jgi:hypothetical protein
MKRFLLRLILIYSTIRLCGNSCSQQTAEVRTNNAEEIAIV